MPVSTSNQNLKSILSTAPNSTSATAAANAATAATNMLKQLRPFDVNEVKILLLENVNQTAVKLLKNAGYQVGLLYSRSLH